MFHQFAFPVVTYDIRQGCLLIKLPCRILRSCLLHLHYVVRVWVDVARDYAWGVVPKMNPIYSEAWMVDSAYRSPIEWNISSNILYSRTLSQLVSNLSKFTDKKNNFRQSYARLILLYFRSVCGVEKCLHFDMTFPLLVTALKRLSIANSPTYRKTINIADIAYVDRYNAMVASKQLAALATTGQ
jgi:hypothetical protein